MQVNSLEIEHPWDTLTVTYQSELTNSDVSFRLKNSHVTYLQLTAGTVSLTFCADLMEQSQGFAIDARTYPLNGRSKLFLSVLILLTYVCHISNGSD